MTARSEQRLQLTGKDRAKYFAPVAFAGYICAICVALMVTSPFLSNRKQAIAVLAAGLFGLVLSAMLAAVLWYTQRRELRYWPVVTRSSAGTNFQRVVDLAGRLGWSITDSDPARSIQARTADSLLQQGEIVAVQFSGSLVSVASICDPDVGYSLVGRQRCQKHRSEVTDAVLAVADTNPVQSVARAATG